MKNSYFKPVSGKTFALARIDLILGRTLAGSLAFLSLLTILNLFPSADHLKPVAFWVTFGAFILLVLGMNLSQFLFNRSKFWFRAHSTLVMILVFTFPLQVSNTNDMLGQFEPWMWWASGLVPLSAVFGFGTVVGLITALVLPVSWFLLRQSAFGGAASLQTCIEESSYTLLFALCFGALLLLLRNQAADADTANQLASEAAAEQARVDALEREQLRLDALVHDRVLTTLVLAARANNPSDELLAYQVANEALGDLDKMRTASGVAEPGVTVASLFSALKATIGWMTGDVEVLIDSSNDTPVPAAVAAAITEATLQAVSNSLQHAGPRTKLRQVRLKAQKRGMKLVILDDGKGFRPSNIPQNRLGVRVSMIGRVETVGGRLFIDSHLGKGTTIIMDWAEH